MNYAAQFQNTMKKEVIRSRRTTRKQRTSIRRNRKNKQQLMNNASAENKKKKQKNNITDFEITIYFGFTTSKLVQNNFKIDLLNFQNLTCYHRDHQKLPPQF